LFQKLEHLLIEAQNLITLLRSCWFLDWKNHWIVISLGNRFSFGCGKWFVSLSFCTIILIVNPLLSQCTLLASWILVVGWHWVPFQRCLPIRINDFVCFTLLICMLAGYKSVHMLCVGQAEFYNRLKALTAVHHTHRPSQWKHGVDDGFTLEFSCRWSALAAKEITQCSLFSSHMWGTQHVGILQNGKPHYWGLYSCKIQIANSIMGSTRSALSDI
jgi:hypothetical protein